MKTNTTGNSAHTIYKGIKIIAPLFTDISVLQSAIDNLQLNDYRRYEVITTMTALRGNVYYDTCLAEFEGKVILYRDGSVFDSIEAIEAHIDAQPLITPVAKVKTVMGSYYADQLAKLGNPRQGYTPSIKITGSTSFTDDMSLNDESATALVSWLTDHYSITLTPSK